MICESKFKEMSKPSSKTAQCLLRLRYFYNHLPNSKPSSSFASRFHSTTPKFTPLNPKPSNATPFHFLAPSKPNSSSPTFLPFAFRHFANFSKDFGKKINPNFAKGVFEKPATVVSSTFSRYREAVGLQIDAFLKRNYLFLIGAGGVVICALLWRIMFGIANTFVSLSEGMAKYGFLALSAAIVAFTVSFINSTTTSSYLHCLALSHTSLQTIS